MPETVQPAEMLRLNTSVEPTPFDDQDRLGLLAGQADGFPNGRRVGDDVVDFALRAVAGGTPFTPDFNVAPNNELTDGVDENDRPSAHREALTAGSSRRRPADRAASARARGVAPGG
jgi:hypothetical protein